MKILRFFQLTLFFLCLLGVSFSESIFPAHSRAYFDSTLIEIPSSSVHAITGVVEDKILIRNKETSLFSSDSLSEKPLELISDLAVAKSSIGSFSVGNVATYTLTIVNKGLAATNGLITVVDVLPKGLKFIEATGSGWDIVTEDQKITFTTLTSIEANDRASPITLTLGVDNEAFPNVTNEITIIDHQMIKTSFSDLIMVDDSPQVRLTLSNSLVKKTHNDPYHNYHLIVGNIGSIATDGSPLSVINKIPEGLTFITGEGEEWSISKMDNSIMCTSSQIIDSGEKSTPINLTMIKHLEEANLTNTASVSGGGASNCATADYVSLFEDAQPLNFDNKLKNFPEFAQSETYTLVVGNDKSLATHKEVTIQNKLPFSLNYLSSFGKNWTVSALDQTITMKTHQGIQPEENSHPVTLIFSNPAELIDKLKAKKKRTQIGLGLALTKSASPTVSTTVGETITYSFLLTNTGTNLVNSFTITDTFTPPAGPPLIITICEDNIILPGQSTTCRAFYQVTQADIDNGLILNTAMATGTTLLSETYTSNLSSAIVTTQVASLFLQKFASPTVVSAAGDTINYSFAVTNTGNTELTNINIVDPLLDSATPPVTITCLDTTLEPGESTACTASYTVTQADIDSGLIDNMATAIGTPPLFGPVESEPAHAIVTVTSSPSLTITKTASPTTFSVVGQTITYSFAVTNTGNLTLHNILINDTFTSPASPPLTISCPLTTLAPGASTTCTATYTVTQADINQGSIMNTAFATGTTPGGSLVNSTSVTKTIVFVASQSSLTMSKSATPTTVTAAGQTVTYSFLVTNTGLTTLSNVTIIDTFTPPAGPALVISCPATTLVPGQSTTCTAVYTVTQADINQGSIANSAVARGIDPNNLTITSPPSTATVNVTQSPSLTVSKSATPTTVTAAGQTVSYSFLVTNTGNVTLTSVSLTDTFTTPATPPLSITCPATTLAPGASTTCTATYTVKQADINKGSIANSVVAAGIDPNGVTFTSSASTATVSVTQAPSLTVSKSATPTTVTAAGQTVTYSFSVTNTGNVTLTGVSITDSFTAPATPALSITCPATTLAPGASTTCTATYTVKQADIDQGSIANSAFATGVDPNGVTFISASSTATVTVTQTPSLTVSKSAVPTTVTAAGQTVTYSFLVTNTGNVTLTGVSITDSFTAPATPSLSITCSATTLAPGASTTCTATYTVKQADINKGSIVNSAFATGVDPNGVTFISASSTATVTVTQAPSLTVSKSAAPTTVNAVGQTITYSFLVTNTGNVTLAGVSLTDTFTAPATPPLSITCPATTLAPGASTTCTATYTVKQADLNQGSIMNSVVATGTSPGGTLITSATSSAMVLVTQSASLTVVKSATPTTVTAAGQTIAYSFLVQNTGNVTLTGVAISDTFTSPAAPPLAITCPATTLAPGSTTTCTATYIVTQADIDNGSIANSAVATGTSPGGTLIMSPVDTVTVAVTQSPSLTVVKSVTAPIVTTPGQTIAYSFAVQNIGNVTLTSVSIGDTFTAPAAPPLAITCLATTLAPGSITTCTASYIVTQADIDKGSIVNSAVATGMLPNGTTVTSLASMVVVPVAQSSSLTVTKSVIPPTVSSAGQVLDYFFVVKNTGNVTLTGVSITDLFILPAGPSLAINCPATTLAPNATTTCSATYIVTQADIDHGSIINSAVATGVNPSGNFILSSPSVATVTVTQAPNLTIFKSANPTTAAIAGETINYSFLVTNTGNVTLTGVFITDTFTAPASTPLVISCPATTLAPNATTNCTATYIVKQADINQGSILNSAVATGTPPSGIAVTSTPSTATVTIVQMPSLSIVKSGTPPVVANAGETINYSFVVTNSGNVTLTNVFITDTLTPPASPPLVISCPATTLVPGALMTCTATYTVTQADIDQGSIVNSVFATGTSPAGALIISAPSTLTTPVTQSPILTLVKSTVPTTVTVAGETITYSFLVTNTGNETINNVTITDTFTPPASPALAITCPATTLVPGANTTCTATYTVTQADIDHGSIENTAFTTGITTDGDFIESLPSTVTVGVIQSSNLTLVKTSSLTVVTAAGQRVTYSFLVTNTGNDTLTNVTITDTFIDPAGPPLAITCPATTLAPGEMTSCTATYFVTKADIDKGLIVNTAVATARSPSDELITSEASRHTITVAQVPRLILSKSASPTIVDFAGQTVNYSFLITNNGNVTIHNLTINDVLDPPAGPDLNITCGTSSLAPGESTTCLATYIVKREDIKHGSIRNTATVIGNTVNGIVVASNSSTVTVNISILPPSCVKGFQKVDRVATQTDIINIITWKAPSKGEPPVAYKIFSDRQLTKLISTISSHHHSIFEDHNRKKGETYTYYLVSVDQFGTNSAPVKVVIKGEK